MFFKNLMVYRFTRELDLDSQGLAEALSENVFSPCHSQDVSRYGWVSPVPQGSDLVHAANGFTMLCAKKQEKILPRAAIKEELEERIADIEEEQNRKVGRKERKELSEEIEFSMLSRAFTKSRLQYAYIDHQQGYLVINATSANRAEEFLDLLRDSLGSLPVVPLKSVSSPESIMTAWLKGSVATDAFQLGGDCELQSQAEEKSTVRCKNLDLSMQEVVGHLEQGMQVSKLAFNWQERIDCVLDSNLAIKQLRFSDLIQEKVQADNCSDAAELFDSEFAIMTLEVSHFLEALILFLGGEDLDKDGGNELAA